MGHTTMTAASKLDVSGGLQFVMLIGIYVVFIDK
jgi:hypothetical protein